MRKTREVQGTEMMKEFIYYHHPCLEAHARIYMCRLNFFARSSRNVDFFFRIDFQCFIHDHTSLHAGA